MRADRAARIFGGLAGLYGAAGVALAAAGAHIASGSSVTTAAYFLLFHAGALLGLSALSLVRRLRASLLGAALIAAGVFVFSGDLALRGLKNIVLVHMAAPTGGLMMIAGWLLVGIALPVELSRPRQLNVS